MNIVELPVEILIKIFRYLPCYKNVSIVNKLFYKIAGELWDSKICLYLHSELFAKAKNRKLLESIRKTKRKITSIKAVFLHRLESENFKTLIAIVKKFSAIIKYMEFTGELNVSDLLDILSLVANAEHLVFSYLTYPTHRPIVMRIAMLRYKELNLHRLRTLKLVSCKEFVVLFNRLPAGVLTEFTLHTGNLYELRDLFTEQTNIKKLTIKNRADFHTVAFPANIFDHLTLESFELDIYPENHSRVEAILSKQTALQSLKLIGGVIGKDLMNVIANQLTELKTFSMNVDDTPVAAFNNIGKLKNLHDLTLESDEDEHVTQFESFATLDNSRITTLNIQYEYDVSNDLIAALAKSVPNLKILHFGCDYSYRIFNETMKRFNFVESLRFGRLGTHLIKYSYNDKDGSTLMEGEFFNPNLTELQIFYRLPLKAPLLDKLLSAYPNLKKLVVGSSDPISASQFKLILNGFKKMESLSLFKGSPTLRLGDLGVFREHRNHLKFVWLMDTNADGFKVAALSTIFDLVEYADVDGLKMAVDRATMKSDGRFCDIINN